MGEGNHLSATGPVGQPKGRWKWVLGGTVVAVLASGGLMQYVRSTTTKADSDAPAGSARLNETPKKRLMAKVADESISYDQVAEECVKRYGREVLDDLIHRMIIQKACEKNKVSVSDQEISEEIDRISKRFNLDATQWLQMLQAERNISPLQYRQSVIFPMIALKKLASEEVEIDDQEMKEAFIRNYGPRVKARMIMFDNERRARDGWDQLQKDPEDFEKLAAKLSIDPSSRALGGQIPPIPKYNGNENLEKAAFKLKKEEISGVIEVGPSRFIILKCEGRTEPVVTDIEEVRSTIYDELKESKVQAAVARTFEQIKKDTPVDNYLAQTSTRPERAQGIPGAPKGNIQPTSGTKPSAPPSKTATSSGANATKPARQ